MLGKRSFWLSPKGIAAMAAIASVSYFLLMEHRAHTIQYLPFLIFLLCPLMHIFMHGGHGDHDKKTSVNSEDGQHSETGSHMVDMDDYRRGYKDAVKEIENKQSLPESGEDNNAR